MHKIFVDLKTRKPLFDLRFWDSIDVLDVSESDFCELWPFEEAVADVG